MIVLLLVLCILNELIICLKVILQVNGEDKAKGHTSSANSKTENAENESSDGSLSDSDAENDKGGL